MSRAYLEIPRRFAELPPADYAALLDRIAKTPAMRDAFKHFGSDRVSPAYHVRLGLRLLDPTMLASDRAKLAKDLVPIAARYVPTAIPVPRGCKVTPIPDLTHWHGASDFWRKLVTDQETGCWEMRGARGKHPRVRIHGRLYSAHRVAYTLRHGPIPVGKGYHGTEVMHSCDNSPCCNPDHLSLGTQRDNVLDMVAKGRGGFACNGVSA